MDTENTEPPREADALDRIGILIDHASDSADDEMLEGALRQLDELASEAQLSDEHRILVHYFRANAFEAKLRRTGNARTLSWDIPFFTEVLFELRHAVRDEKFSTLDPIRQCQILTNLGSKLNSVGRPVEAVRMWDRALAVMPNFALALGNRGDGLFYYANSLYEDNDRALLYLGAHDSLLAAADKGSLYDSPENYEHRTVFLAHAAEISKRLDLDVVREVFGHSYSLGRSKVERSYRDWALQKRLFLNPLNELGVHSIAAFDILHLPPLTTDIAAEPPALIGFFNQLKQEFISARWLLFEGTSDEKAHFSDDRAYLYDSFGIPAYHLAVEKTKLSFRMSYSLLDKVAFFINDYFKVGLRERDVSFRSVWYQPKTEPKALSPVFSGRENWLLRGLYWLSRDIYESEFKAVAEPAAEDLAGLRNHLEHKYCQVYEDMGIKYSDQSMSRNGVDIGLHMGRDALEAKALHILGLARAALIYLSLSVHREETLRNSERDPGFIAQMPLMVLKNKRG